MVNLFSKQLHLGIRGAHKMGKLETVKIGPFVSIASGISGMNEKSF